MPDVYVEDREDQPYLVKEFDGFRYEFPMPAIFQRYQIENDDPSDIAETMGDYWDEDDIRAATDYWTKDSDNFYGLKDMVDEELTNEDLWNEKLDSYEKDSNIESVIDAVEQELEDIVEHDQSPFSTPAVVGDDSYVLMPITEGDSDAAIWARDKDYGAELGYAIVSDEREKSTMRIDEDSELEDLEMALNLAFNDIMANVDFS